MSNAQRVTFYLVNGDRSEGVIIGCNGTVSFSFVKGKSGNVNTFDATYQSKAGKIAVSSFRARI